MKRIGGWFSFALLADILYCLPGTTTDVVERSGISQWRAVHLMRQLHALKLVHKARFEYRGLRRSPMTVWDRGNLPDAVAITKSGAPRKPHALIKTQPLSAQVIAFASLMRALQEPQTVASLIEETGVSPRTAGRFIKHLRETGRVYIASWERSRYLWAAEYVLGTKRSVERPAPMTKQQLNARWNAARAHRNRQRAVESAIVRNVSAGVAA